MKWSLILALMLGLATAAYAEEILLNALNLDQPASAPVGSSVLFQQ